MCPLYDLDGHVTLKSMGGNSEKNQAEKEKDLFHATEKCVSKMMKMKGYTPVNARELAQVPTGDFDHDVV
jgi:hypothetical protein